MKLTKTMMVLAGILLFGGTLYAQAAAKKAKAVLINAQGQQIGTASFAQATNGVRLTLSVSHLPPGAHGFHIHTVGKCDPPDFKSAGGHFNPTGKKHGLKNPEGYHAGDLQNLTVAANGKATAKVVITTVTLGEGANSLFQPGGTALVIHADPDDEMTDPAGNAGARIACGVIK